jgi:hypothetical protein
MSDAGSGYRFSRDASGDSGWTRVSDGDLPMPIEIRFGYAPDGRFTVTGLRLDVDPLRAADPSNIDLEITSATLRQIKLSEIKAAFFESQGTWLQAIMPDDQSLARSIAHEQVYALRPPSRGPETETLRKFADAYRIELTRQPHRAMTAVAKALNISRATANRWTALCRELGYLPNPSEGKKTDATDQDH